MERNPKHQLHVAVLDEELPFPLDSGKRIRTFNLLSRLAQRQRITYLCHRHRYLETETQPLKRWYIRRQFRKFERFERWAYSSCDRAIAVSDEDAALIRGRFGARQTAVVDNGVDAAFFEAPARVERNPYRILFL